MSSSAPVSATTAPGAITTGFSVSNKTETTGNVLGGFAAILDGLLEDVPVVGALIDGLIGEADDIAPALPQIDISLGTETDTLDLATVAVGLEDLLADLQEKLDAGETPDDDLLEKIATGLDALAAALDLQQPATTAEVAPPATTAEPSSLERLADLASRIAQRMADSDGGIPAKLVGLATALTNPALAPALLAKLGIEAGVAAAAEIAANNTPDQFAAPALKLPEGGSATATLAVASASAAADPETNGGNQQSAGGDTTRPAPAAELKIGADAPTDQTSAPQGQVAANSIQPATGTVRAVHAAYQAPHTPQQLNLPQLAFEIIHRARLGDSRFEIRLDPPELGRIDVRMDVDAGGNVNARLTVERVETLDLLQRDQRQLERALAQAGLDGPKTNLEFSLKNNERQGGGDGRPAWTADTGVGREGDVTTDPLVAATTTIYRGAASARGVNIFV